MRELPHSLEAEMAILGAILIYPRTAMIVKESNLQVEDFFALQNQHLFANIESLIKENQPVDITTLTNRLIDNQQINQIGGSNYLVELTQNSTTPENMRYYIEIVQGKSQLRNLIDMAQKIQDSSFDSTVPLAEAIEFAEKEVLRVTRSRNTGEMKAGSDVISEVMHQVRSMSENKSSVTGLKTSFKPLDRMTSGLQRGDMIILAARPSAGKTAFALNLGMNVSAANNATVAIFSLEMPAEHLMQRMLACRSNVPISSIRTGFIQSDSEWIQLDDASSFLAEKELYMDDGGNITVASIASKCRKLKMEKGLDLIIIDYIQLISGNSRSDNRQQEVSEISRSLKQLARELNVPIIALSQLSRLVERRENNRPMLSDLRESGSIEQDADIVIFLSRQDYQKTAQDEGFEENKESVVDVYIAKHRNGATGDFQLSFKRETNAFKDVILDREGGNQ